jgi:hypothetical protein
MPHLAYGLLIRAALLRQSNLFEQCDEDLEEVSTIVARSGMRLLEADCLIERARLFFARNQVSEAWHALNKAEAKIRKIQYCRRFQNVQELKNWALNNGLVLRRKASRLP